MEERKFKKYRVSELTYEIIENSIRAVVDIHAGDDIKVVVEDIHWDKDFRGNREDFIYVTDGGAEHNGSIIFELGEQGFDVNIYLYE